MTMKDMEREIPSMKQNFNYCMWWPTLEGYKARNIDLFWLMVSLYITGCVNV
jgi:hypothetical protein